MTSNKELVRKAAFVVNSLLGSGEVAVNRGNGPEVLEYYEDPRVREIVELFEDEMNFKVLHASDRLYLLPGFGNTALGYSREDLKKAVLGGSYGLKDLYLVYFIGTVIIASFYSGDGYDAKNRDAMFIEEVIHETDAILKNGSDESMLSDFAEAEVNIDAVCGLWNSLMRHDETKGLHPSAKTQVGYILKTVGFLEKSGLLRISDNKQEIYATPKLDDIIKYYYMDGYRKKEIIDLFEKYRGGAENAED